MERLTQTEKNRLKSLEDAGHCSTKPLIQRVTHILLRDNKDFEQYFKPISVALGPLHHDYRPDSKLQRGEKNKLQMAAKFIEYSGTKKEVFYSKVKAEINSLRECYDSKQIETWSDDYLAWMFLVDGCAVLFFIDHDATGKLDKLGDKDVLAYLKLDLFLFENQLPYRLLQILMTSCTRVPRKSSDEKDEIDPPDEKDKIDPAKVLEDSIFINKNSMGPVVRKQLNQLPYRLLQILMTSCTRVPCKCWDEKDEIDPPDEKDKIDPAKVLEDSISTFINKNSMGPVVQKEPQKHELLPQKHSEKLNNQTHQQQQQQQKQQQQQQQQRQQQQQQQQKQQRQQQQQSEIMIDQTQEEPEPEPEPAHLLELLWIKLTKSKKVKEPDGTMSMLLKKLCPSRNKGSDGTMSKGIISNSDPGDKESDRTTGKGKSSNSNPGVYRHTFRSVKELKEKGIWLQVSKSNRIDDISFKENFFVATLSLPPITVDDFTGPKLMNLIAYEMCPGFENNFEITSYVSFLDSLIDQKEDVKELRDAGVLDNRLGSDKAVALLFNKISKNLVPNPWLHVDLKDRIQAHCNNAFSTHVAQLYHTYFRSPWSILAFLGALLGLGMTAVQTYYEGI